MKEYRSQGEPLFVRGKLGSDSLSRFAEGSARRTSTTTFPPIQHTPADHSSPTLKQSDMSLVVPEAHVQFQHILRLLNTNVDGKRKIMYALTEIKGVGRRYANVVCKKADVDLDKR